MTVFALVDGIDAVDPPLSLVTLKEVDALSTVHEGDHRLLGRAYRSLLAHIDALGLIATGDAREHYTIEPSGSVRTRLSVPVA